MKVWDIFLIALAVLGISGIIILPFTLILWLWFWWRGRKLKRNIPIKLLQEVENDRERKELRIQEAAGRYELRQRDSGIEREAEESRRVGFGYSDSGVGKQPENIQPMADRGDSENQRGHKPIRFNPI